MHRPARINPDTRVVVIAAVVLALAIVSSSFVLSFHGLRDVAAWGNMPASLAWLVPVMVDAALLTYTLAWLVRRARGESSRLAWCALALFTVVSTLGNALHGWQPDVVVQRVIGTVVVGLAPLAVLLATHTLAQLLTTPEFVDQRTGVRTDDASEALARWASDPNLWRASTDDLARLRERRAETSPAEPVAQPTDTPAWSDVPLFDVDQHDPKARARQLRAEGMSVRQIAQLVGLSKSTVATAVQGVKVAA